MKDAFGGSYMLYIMIIFFVIFISFMTVAISWARAFKIKSDVINIIEKSDPRDTSENSDSPKTLIDNYLNTVGYDYSRNQKVKSDCNKRKRNMKGYKFPAFIKGNPTDRGVCLIPKGSEGSYYYEVTSYIAIDFPFFRLGLVIPITGESKTISNIFTEY